MNKQQLRILFYGTAPFAAQHLEFLIAEQYHVVGVVTTPDKPAGRGHKLKGSAVKEVAEKHRLPLWQPENLRDESFIQEITALQPTLGVVIAFRMLPKSCWAMPPLGTVNVHASLLPRWRGAAPINHALMAGDQETGVTLFSLSEGLDQGGIYGTRSLSIDSDIRFGELYDALAKEGVVLLNAFLQQCISQEKISWNPQPLATDEPYAHKLTKENTRIDWSRSAAEIHNWVRGLSPLPTAWTEFSFGASQETIKFKIFRTQLIPEFVVPQGSTPGMLLSSPRGSLYVATGMGVLAIKELQAPGKKRMPIAAFLNGTKIDSEARFI